MREKGGNHSAGKRADLYQLGLFNLCFTGYFYMNSVNLCPDIKKLSPVSNFLPFGRF